MEAGTGTLAFEKVAGRTAITRAAARNPLRFLTPGNQGKFAWAYLTSFGGGFVNGDAFSIDLNVGRGAESLVLTQSATKVYRSPSGTSQKITARVEEGGTLVSLPDPVICFEGSRFIQHQEFQLARGASVVMLDALSSGRHTRGERWAFAHYASTIELFQEGKLSFFDRLVLDPSHGDLVLRLGRFDCMATLLLWGPAFSAAAAEILESVNGEPVRRRADFAIAASPVAGGLVLRVAARRTEALMQTIQNLLSFLPEQFGDNPWSRKF